MKNNFKLTLYLKDDGIVGTLSNKGKNLPVSVTRSFKDDKWVYSAIVSLPKYAGGRQIIAKKTCKEKPSPFSMITFLSDANKHIQFVNIGAWAEQVSIMLEKKMSYKKENILLY